MVALNSKHRTKKQRKHRKTTKTSLPNKLLEKADPGKPVLDKIMTTRE